MSDKHRREIINRKTPPGMLYFVHLGLINNFADIAKNWLKILMAATPTNTVMTDDSLFQTAVAAYEDDRMDLAIHLFNQLAEQGVAEAMQYLGLIWRTGDGVPQNLEQSQLWYARYHHAVEAQAMEESPEALLTLGQIYQYGDQVKIDNEKACTCIRRSAELGHPAAQFHMATLFQFGWAGLPVDHEEATAWLEIAAANNHPEALYKIGLRLIETGYSHRGAEYVKKSAQLGFWIAQEYVKSGHS